MTQYRVTVVCREVGGYPDPLIYVLTVPDPADEPTLLDRLAAIRFDEIEGHFDPEDPGSVSRLAEIRENLKLCFVFAGEPHVVYDARD